MKVALALERLIVRLLVASVSSNEDKIYILLRYRLQYNQPANYKIYTVSFIFQNTFEVFV